MIKFLIVLYCVCATSLYASHHHLFENKAGNFLEFAIPATALGTTLWLKDFDGSQEFVKGLAATVGTTYGLKYLVNEKRPKDGRHSFPSGHAAFAFFGSGFIHQRYGWQYAVPTYAAAAFVGYSRLHSKKHWVQDVVGGAAIGLLYSVLFTTPYQCHSCDIYPLITPSSVSICCEKEF